MAKEKMVKIKAIDAHMYGKELVEVGDVIQVEKAEADRLVEMQLSKFVLVPVSAPAAAKIEAKVE